MKSISVRMQGAWRVASVLVLAGLLQACSKSDSAAEPPPPPTATLEGRVGNAADGSAVAGATVSAGERSVQSGADGRWRLDGLAPAERQLLRVRAAGFADALIVRSAPAGESRAGEVPLLPAGPATTVDPTQPVTVQDAGGSARLTAPANAFARAEGGAAPAGPLTVRLTSVDPALDPTRMPGDYSAQSGGSVVALESFGAVKVDVRDAAGNRYTIAPGAAAQLRIPASSRGNLPDQVGLYSLDEVTGRWVDEGAATLAGNGTQRWYEATISHLSWWNADIPLDTVSAIGCLRDAAGNPVAGRTLRSEGLDYNGSATARTDAAGNFRVAFKREARATLLVDAPAGGGAGPAPQAVGPTATDITLPGCLQDRGGSGAVAPTLLTQPQPQTGVAGLPVSFSVLADAVPAPRYQWQRNGTDVAGAIGPVLSFTALASDNGATYRVRVSNAAGTVLSAEAALAVLGEPQPAAVLTPPADATAAPGTSVTFSVTATGSPPLAYQWQRGQVDLPGETGSTLTLGSVSSADNGARFRVRVSNAWGAEFSREATLTVGGGTGGGLPVITGGQPVDTLARVGQQIRWSVQATGSAPLGYQWRRNGVPLAGATGNTLTFVVQAADDGASYAVTVSNSLGSVTSQSGRITLDTGAATGSLAVGGDATRFVDGTFTPNTPQAGVLVRVTPTGPTCITPTGCISSWNLIAVDQSNVGGLGTAELLTVAVTSVVDAPGVQPGLQPTTVSVIYSVTRTQLGSPATGAGYRIVCTANSTDCPSPASAGVTVDPAARTVRFQNTRLVNTADGSITTLNGTLGY